MTQREGTSKLGPANQKAARLLFSVSLLALSLLAYFVPYFDWDLVAYVGSAIALHESNSAKIQREAYESVQRGIPPEEYNDIVGGSEFRRDVANNPDHFRQQLRFYQIRPLYIRVLAVLHKLGLDYVLATRTVSVIAFAGMGALLLVWARRYIGEWTASICIPLLLIAPVLFTSARTGSPDAISALFVLLGTFELIERDHFAFGVVVLLLSLFLRTDNAILIVLLLAWIAVSRSSTPRRAIAGGCILFTIIIVFGINRLEHGYSWSTLMSNTDDPIVNPAEANPTFTVGQYFTAVHDMIDEFRESSVLVFPFVAALVLCSSRLPRTLRALTIIVLLSWAAHVVLYPHIEDRYFIAGAALIGLSAVVATSTSAESGRHGPGS